MRSILNELFYNNVKTNVLICEEDCYISNYNNFKDKIISLRNKDFDCAVFGGEIKEHAKNLNENFNDYFLILNGQFWKAHCILWSPQGIKKINSTINLPIEMQFDHYISYLSNINNFKILIEKKNTAEQYYHISNLSNDQNCKICNMDAKGIKNSKTLYEIIKDLTIYIIIFIIIILIFIIILS